ncbi:MAG: type III pantothenate kinase [Erysipelotrichaceae bacterium]|nr:type III pantothenate kinase [Erysipelotrichaceae bacterium]
MLLTVDMGNTHIEIGLLEGDEVVLSRRIKTDTEKTETEYAVLIHTIFEINKIDINDIEGAIISSVVPPLTRYIREAIKSVTGKTALVVAPGIKTGLKMKVEDPKIIGADLIVGAVAGIEQQGAPLLIVDMGTATTIMAIDKDKQFLGGAVMPGVMLSINALSSGTSQLPSISIEAPKKVINSGTIEAMQSGIVYGQASLIDGMLTKMKRELGYDTKVIATGGLAKLITPYCETEMTLDSELMLKGLKIIYDKNQKM